MSDFIQVGVTALRDPATGGFLPSVPLYIKAGEGVTEKTAAEETARAIGPLFADMMKQYIQGCREKGIRIS